MGLLQCPTTTPQQRDKAPPSSLILYLDAKNEPLPKRIHRLPVVDSNNPTKVVGIVTERNLRLAADSPFLEESAQEVLEHLAKHKVGEIMRSSVTTVTDDASIVEAAKIMRVSNVGGVPVLDKQGQLVGIITRTDMIDHLIRVLEPLDEGQRE